MKKLALSLIAVATMAAGAHGQVLYNHNDETFVAGNLSGQNGWDDHSGTGSQVQVASDGSFTLVQGSGSREDVNQNVGAFTAGNTYYAGFNLSVDGGTSVTDVYFAHFLSGTSTFRSRVWVTDFTGDDFTLAFGNGSSIESTWTTGLSYDTEYVVMMSFDFDTGGANLWIDPLNISSTSIAATADDSALSAIAFRQAGGNTTQVISNLVVGTNFDSVLSSVPEPGTAVLLGLGLLTTVMVRRRRA